MLSTCSFLHCMLGEISRLELKIRDKRGLRTRGVKDCNTGRREKANRFLLVVIIMSNVFNAFPSSLRRRNLKPRLLF